MQQQLQQQLQQRMQTLMQGGMAAMASQTEAHADANATAQGEAAVFDAVFAAQQAQYMQQMQFIQSVRASEAESAGQLIGHVDGPLVECRFTTDFRPLQFCYKFFSADGCGRGAKCTYAHCAEELHPNSPHYPKHLKASSSGNVLAELEQDDDPASKMPEMRMKKKKEICNKWKKDGDGSCVLGKACPFAHGEHEIGTVELVICEKVKIKLCPYWDKGKCVHGKNCLNAHGKEEIGMKRPAFRAPMEFLKKQKEGQSIEDWRNSVLRV